MPWNEVTKMKLKQEFIMQALKKGANISSLCKQYGISRKTGYKYILRYKKDGTKGLEEQSKTPKSSPLRTPDKMEGLIIDERNKHPYWGARKLKKVLENKGIKDVPTKSSVNRVLLRHGMLRPQEDVRTKEWNFFEHEKPNDLWQMDFKGHFEIGRGRCHALTVLDDHSRFSIILNAYANEKGNTVKQGLIEAFRRYGLPIRMNMDNGPPWGTSGMRGFTTFTIWLIRLGIQAGFSSICHPQTNGKDERFHRTLKTELLQRRHFKTLEETQEAFDTWRHIYNTERPHEALGMDVPINRYTHSKREYPEDLPKIEYGATDIVKTVNTSGYVCMLGKRFYVSEGLALEPVALRPTLTDDIFNIFYCHQKIKTVDINKEGLIG